MSAKRKRNPAKRKRNPDRKPSGEWKDDQKKKPLRLRLELEMRLVVGTEGVSVEKVILDDECQDSDTAATLFVHAVDGLWETSMGLASRCWARQFSEIQREWEKWADEFWAGKRDRNQQETPHATDTTPDRS